MRRHAGGGGDVGCDMGVEGEGVNGDGLGIGLGRELRRAEMRGGWEDGRGVSVQEKGGAGGGGEGVRGGRDMCCRS